VFGNDLLACNQNDPARIGAQRDLPSGKPGRNAIAVAVILDQTGRADPNGLLDIAVKDASQRESVRSFVYR
jgi:hypothetical protein